MHTMQSFFDKAANRWDAGWKPDQYARLAEILDAAAIKHNARVLDIGCGTGVLFPLIEYRVEHVVAVDLSEKMLRCAQKKAAVPLVRADALALPFTETFDWAICNSVFPHFSDAPQALVAIRRVLKTGGTLLICHVDSRDTINAIHRRVGGAVAHDVLPDAVSMQTMLEETGFHGIEVHTAKDRYVAHGCKAEDHPTQSQPCPREGTP